MKILEVSDRFGFFGGVEQYLSDVSEALAEAGHEITLLFDASTGRTSGFGRGIAKTVQLGFDRAGEDPERVKGELEAVLKEERPDVAFVHHAEDPEFLHALWERVPVVRMVHDHALYCLRRHKFFFLSGRICPYPAGVRCLLDGGFLAPPEPGRLLPGVRSLPRKLHELEVNRRFERTVVASRYMKRELLINGFEEERIAVLPCPGRIPPDELVESFEARRQNGRVLFVGQLLRGKGAHVLIRAIASFEKPPRVTIIGEGKDRESLERLAKALQVGHRVEFLGWVPHDELGRHYLECALVAMPSVWPEPFGMVGVEAMAHARAVVAFEVGGIPDWLADGVTGVLVRPPDERALAEAIRSLLRDPGRAARLGQNGRRRAKAEFSLEAHIEALTRVLEAAVEAGAAQRTRGETLTRGSP